MTHSHLRVASAAAQSDSDSSAKTSQVQTAQTEACGTVQTKPSGAVLFTTKTCPNCKVAAALLEKAGIPFEKLLVEENRELAKDYGLKQVPALVIKDESGNSTYVGVPEIKKYLA